MVTSLVTKERVDVRRNRPSYNKLPCMGHFPRCREAQADDFATVWISFTDTAHISLAMPLGMVMRSTIDTEGTPTIMTASMVQSSQPPPSLERIQLSNGLASPMDTVTTELMLYSRVDSLLYRISAIPSIRFCSLLLEIVSFSRQERYNAIKTIGFAEKSRLKEHRTR